MAAFCEAVCKNDVVGYSQARRNTLREAARAAGWDAAKITVPCDCDCSSLMAVCAEAAGVCMERAYTVFGNAPWTGNMEAEFTGTGAFDALRGEKYLTSPDYLRRGDIAVNVQHHTWMVLDDGREAKNDMSEIKRGDVLNYTPGHGMHFTPDGTDDCPARELADGRYAATVVLISPNQPRPYLILVAEQEAVGWVDAESLAPLDEDEAGAITDAGPQTHIVTAGDSLWAISYKYGVSMADIAAANGMASVSSVIHPGDVLVIPKKGG